jgi:hypothetical protein
MKYQPAQRSRMSSAKPARVVLLVTGFALCFYWLIGCEERTARLRVEAHNLARSRVILRKAADAIKVLSVERPRAVVDIASKDSGRFDGQKFFTMFFADSENFLALPDEWMRSHAAVDAWGQTLTFEILVRTNTLLSVDQRMNQYEVHIWSNGPNMRNDSGRADDVVESRFFIELPM